MNILNLLKRKKTPETEVDNSAGAQDTFIKESKKGQPKIDSRKTLEARNNFLWGAVLDLLRDNADRVAELQRLRSSNKAPVADKPEEPVADKPSGPFKLDYEELEKLREENVGLEDRVYGFEKSDALLKQEILELSEANISLAAKNSSHVKFTKPLANEVSTLRTANADLEKELEAPIDDAPRIQADNLEDLVDVIKGVFVMTVDTRRDDFIDRVIRLGGSCEI